MRTTYERKQTLLRLPPSLIEDLMDLARAESKSYNSFMEDILSKEVERRKISAAVTMPAKISDAVRKMRGSLPVEITDEMMESDPRTAHAFAYGKK